MPLVAPVMTATLPSSRPMSLSPFLRAWLLYLRPDGTTQAMLFCALAIWFRRAFYIVMAGHDEKWIKSSVHFRSSLQTTHSRLCLALIWIPRSVDVTYAEIDR
jgi:hypothetical protein